MVDRLKDIAEGEGDLTQRVDEDRKDELGELGKWFNKFVETVHDIIAEVMGAAREVASASTQIAASSEEMATGMNEQSEQVTADRRGDRGDVRVDHRGRRRSPRTPPTRPTIPGKPPPSGGEVVDADRHRHERDQRVRLGLRRFAIVKSSASGASRSGRSST